VEVYLLLIDLDQGGFGAGECHAAIGHPALNRVSERCLSNDVNFRLGGETEIE
jgi:hypothetical protein